MGRIPEPPPPEMRRQLERDRLMPKSKTDWVALAVLQAFAWMAGMGMMAFISLPIAAIYYVTWNHSIAPLSSLVEPQGFSQAWLITWAVSLVVDKSWRTSATDVGIDRYIAWKKETNGQKESST